MSVSMTLRFGREQPPHYAALARRTDNCKLASFLWGRTSFNEVRSKICGKNSSEYSHYPSRDCYCYLCRSRWFLRNCNRSWIRQQSTNDDSGIGSDAAYRYYSSIQSAFERYPGRNVQTRQDILVGYCNRQCCTLYQWIRFS